MGWHPEWNKNEKVLRLMWLGPENLTGAMRESRKDRHTNLSPGKLGVGCACWWRYTQGIQHISWSYESRLADLSRRSLEGSGLRHPRGGSCGQYLLYIVPTSTHEVGQDFIICPNPTGVPHNAVPRSPTHTGLPHKKMSWAPASTCFLTADAMWPGTSHSSGLAFPTMSPNKSLPP